jgi:glycine/D-amino acid oxidase-like deaminating enzyme
MDKNYEVIVVGCGGLGSAALYWLSRELGSSVLGLEQFRLPSRRRFYGRLVKGLGALGIRVSINTTPFDLDDEQRLDENVFHRVCDREYVGRYARVLGQVDQVFNEFA